jgi:hypothetical protein
MRRPGDNTPEPLGGRAAERLQMYEQARGVTSESPVPPKKKLGAKRKKNLDSKQSTPNKETSPHEEQKRSSDST